MMTIREYKRAESLEEAWQLNQKKPNRILGGMIWLKMETINVGTAIDLSGLGLDTIEETEDSFSIGAMVTLRQLEQHPGLAAYTHGAMREAVRHIVGVQLRNLATVGGSIYSRFGFSDVLTMFLAMDCDVELYKGGILPLQEYAQRPYDRDVLVRLIVKKTPMKLYYQSVRNSQTDSPVLTCAAARMETGDYRSVRGARPLRAVRFELPAEPALAAEQLAAQFAEGIGRFTVGLGKKVLIANQVGALWDTVAALPGTSLTAGTAWLGALAFTFQIYFDFSGYSDMAIGLGKMLGFQFLENFDYPYLSRSITEYWRRWHISLGTWFRE